MAASACAETASVPPVAGTAGRSPAVCPLRLSSSCQGDECVPVQTSGGMGLPCLLPSLCGEIQRVLCSEGVVYHLTLRAGFLGHPCHRQVVSGCRRELTVLLETAHRRPAERNLFIFPFLLKHTQVSRVRSGPLLWQVTSSSWAQRGCRRPVPAPGLPRTCRESPPALTAVRVLPGLSRGSCCSALFFSAVRQRPQGSGLRRKTPVLPAGPVSPCAGPSPASGWGRGY